MSIEHYQSPYYTKPTTVEVRREDTFLFIESMLSLIEYQLTYDRHAGEPHNITAGVRMVGWGPGLYLTYGVGQATRHALVYNDWFPQGIGVWMMHDHEYSVTQGQNQQRFANFHPGASRYAYMGEEQTIVANNVLDFLIYGRRPELAEFVVTVMNNFDKGGQKHLHFTPESNIKIPSLPELPPNVLAEYEAHYKRPLAYRGDSNPIPNPPPFPLEEMYAQAMSMANKPKPKTHADIPLHVPVKPEPPPTLQKGEVWIQLLDDDSEFYSPVKHPARVLDVSQEPQYQDYTNTEWILAYLTRYAKFRGVRQQAWVHDQLARINFGAEVAVLRCVYPDGVTEDFYMTMDKPKQYVQWQAELENANCFYDPGEAPFKVV